MPTRSPPVPLSALSTPLFTVAMGGDTHALSLATLLATLLAGNAEIDSFPNLTAEQRGHWKRFLVRCAAKALHELGLATGQARRRSADELAGEIASALGRAAPPTAWLLHQPDPSEPGFLQISTPNGKPPGDGNNYKPNPVSLLTSTIGGKNHERKADIARELTPEQAVYALIEYQFSAIFGGRGNYETQLLGSRAGAGSGVPFMGPRIGDSRAETFRHDVQVLLDRWDTVARELQGPVWALWTEPWDGKGQFGSERLDPAFIPVARMIRFAAPEGGLFRTVWFRPTDTGRVRDHTGGGVLGDPLLPLVPDPRTGDPKVRGTLRKGYDYAEVVRLLFGTDEQGGTPSASVQALANRGELERRDLRVVFEGTAYEQGKTGGYHRREVLLPFTTARRLRNPEPLRATHTEMLQRIVEARNALHNAASIALNGRDTGKRGLAPLVPKSDRKRQNDRAKTAPLIAALEQRLDAEYLGLLFAAVERGEAGQDDWLQPFLDWLTSETERVFHAGKAAIPVSTSRRWERETHADQYLRNRMRALCGLVERASIPDVENFTLHDDLDSSGAAPSEQEMPHDAG